MVKVDLRALMRIYLFVVFYFIHYGLLSQAPVPLKTFESAKNAVPLCDLTLLNNRTYQNDPFDPTKPTSDLPCGRGGKLENFMIFPFIANSTDIEIVIDNQLCSRPSNGLLGLQVAILQDLDKTENCLFIYENVRTTGETLDIRARSSGFIPGNRYFLLIDGNGGSQCNFRVRVRNLSTSIQPSLSNISAANNILNRFEVRGRRVDSIQYCIGVDSFYLDLPAGNLDLSYKWFFNPKPPNYTDTIRTDSISRVQLFFNQPGIYTLTNIATNKCSEVTNQIKIYVGDPPKEVEDFGKVSICSDKVQFLSDTLRLFDPNKDGLFGWNNSFGILQDGIIVDSFKNIFNCTITQSMDLSIVPNAPGRDTVVACGQYMDNNITLTATSEGEITFIPELLNKNGCDSVVLRKVYIPKIEGSSSVAPCNVKGKSTIDFSPQIVSLPPDANVNYIWKDQNGNLVSDTDGISTTLVTDQQGQFFVSAFVSGNTFTTCTLNNISSFIFDPQSLRPSATALLSAVEPLCPDDSLVTLTVASLQTDSYIWSLPAGVSIIKSSAKSDTVNIKINKQDEALYTLKVAPMNACGTGDTLIINITKYGRPSNQIILPASICQNEEITIRTEKRFDSGWNHTWFIGKGSLNSGNLSNGDSIKVTLISTLTDTIRLSAQRGNCPVKVLDQKLVKASPAIRDFTIGCSAQATQITFSWPSQDTTCVKEYVILKGDSIIARVKGLEYTVKNLLPGTAYTYDLQVNSTCGCKSVKKTMSCITISCDLSKPDLMASSQSFCETSKDSFITTRTMLPSGFDTGKLSYSGTGIDTSGRINLKLLKTGLNMVYVNYQYLDCKNIDSLELTIHPIPVFEIEITQPVCRGENEGTYIAKVKNSTNFDFLLNNRVSSSSGRLPVGNYLMGVRSEFGCFSQQNHSVSPNLNVKYELKIPESIFEDDPLEAELLLSDTLHNIYDSVVWRIEGVRVCSGKECKDLVRYNNEPGRYKIDFQLYYKGCVLGEGRDLIVKPLSKLVLPNIISKTGINGNDRFSFNSLSNEVTVNKVMIFNRWGNSLFSADNVNPEGFVWEMKVNGQPIQNGVYLIMVEYTNEKGETKTQKGDLLVLD